MEGSSQTARPATVLSDERTDGTTSAFLIESLSEFAQRVERETRRRGFETAARQAVIGDGAKRIWNIADEQFPDAIQIIDLFHAKGKISTAAKAIFGPESEFGAQWAKTYRDELEAGKLDLCTSSGIVESGCIHVIGARVKQSGMHWTVRGANAIIALRCFKLSDRYDAFMDQRRDA